MTGRDRGSVSVVAAGVTAILVAIVLLSVDAARLLAAQARTETAADAAALAAAQEQVVASEEDPAGAASRFAAANHAELVACRCEPGGSESVVAVRSFGPDLFLLPDRRELRATARAVVDLPAGS
jgi:secretion/DNA translocation related TadE-like protein